jgi:hypothetical protein
VRSSLAGLGVALGLLFACASPEAVRAPDDAAGAGDDAAMTPEGMDAGASADASSVDATEADARVGSPDVGSDAAVQADAASQADAQSAIDASPSFAVIYQKDMVDTLYAMSDVHGGYARLVSLLSTYGLVPAAPSTPEQATWSGGNATLVVIGDMIDKGPQGLEVMDFLHALEASAPTAGGELIVTLGNHEAEFLADPLNSKATASDGIDVELTMDNLIPATIASDADPRGHWLRSRPLGARVGRWFFAHSGDTQGMTIAQLETSLGAALMNGYGDPAITGTNSILESKGWETAAGVGAQYTSALGVDHLVFGHQPAALGPRGMIATDGQGTLFRIDCGMSPDVNDSQGVLLQIVRSGAGEVATELNADGSRVVVWMGP